MKIKLLILSLLFCLNLSGQKLPITGLCLSDIVAVTGGTCLSDAFTNADPAYFDATYAIVGADWLSEFRNYGPSECTRPEDWITVTLFYQVAGVTVTAANVCYYASNWSAPASSQYADTDLSNAGFIYNQNAFGTMTDCTTVSDGYYVMKVGYLYYAIRVVFGRLYYETC